MSVTHVAGLDITWADRYQRQRCAWCGATLIDLDLSMIATEGDTFTPPPFWKAGTLVRVDGAMASVIEGRIVIETEENIDHPDPVPDDACMRIDPAVTA